MVADLIEDVESLEGVPDPIKSRIASEVCKRRKVWRYGQRASSGLLPCSLHC